MKNIAAVAATLLALSCVARDSGSTSPVVSIASGDSANNDELHLKVSRLIISKANNNKITPPIRSENIAIIESIHWAFRQKTGVLITVQHYLETDSPDSDACWLYQVEGAHLIELQSSPFCQWKPSAKLESRNGESWLRIPMSIRQIADSPVGDSFTVVLFSNKTKEACLLYRDSPDGLSLCSQDEINRPY